MPSHDRTSSYPSHSSDSDRESSGRFPHSIKRISVPSPSTSSASAVISDDDIEDAYITSTTTLPSNFGGARARFRKRPRRRSPVQSNRPPPTPSNRDVPASWERHTRGIGSKILAMQGFTGRLGKNADGISVPLVAQARPRNLGVGAGAQRRTSHNHDSDSTDSDSSDGIRDFGEDDIKERRQEDGKEKIYDENMFNRVKIKSGPQSSDNKEQTEKSVLRNPKQQDENLFREGIEDVAADAVFSVPQIPQALRTLAVSARGRVTAAHRQYEAETAIARAAQDGLRRARRDMEAACTARDALDGAHKALSALDLNDISNQAVERVARVTAATSHDGARRALQSVLSRAATIRISADITTCVKATASSGTMDRQAVSRIARTLQAVSVALPSADFAALTARAVLRPISEAIRAKDWEPVRGAGLVDILTTLRASLPRAALSVLAENVVGPRLATLVKNACKAPTRLWVLPWTAIAGRTPLADALLAVRLRLADSLAHWNVNDPSETCNALITDVQAWTPVLSRRKLQLTLATHVVPKLCEAVSGLSSSTSHTQWDTVISTLSAWAPLVSAGVLATPLANAIIQGPCVVARDLGFGPAGWDAARDVYHRIDRCLTARLKEHLRGALAALLFIIHATRVCSSDQSLKAVLLSADVSPLSRNLFSNAVVEKDHHTKPVSHNGENNRSAKGESSAKVGMADVLAMVAEREGLELVGLGDRTGLKAFRFGKVVVSIDVLRRVLVVAGKTVSIDELVLLARKGNEVA